MRRMNDVGKWYVKRKKRMKSEARWSAELLFLLCERFIDIFCYRRNIIKGDQKRSLTFFLSVQNIEEGSLVCLLNWRTIEIEEFKKRMLLIIKNIF